MPAFFIANQLEVTDPDTIAEYRKHAVDSIESAGGRFLVRGEVGERLEGDVSPARIIMIEFDDMAALKAWYDGPGYADLKRMRLSASRSDIFCVEA